MKAITNSGNRALRVRFFGLITFGLSSLMLLYYMNITSHMYDPFVRKGSSVFLMERNVRKLERSYDQNMEQLETTGPDGNSRAIWKQPVPAPAPELRVKTVVLWKTLYEDADWHKYFGALTPEELRVAGCPIWQCNFTSDTSLLETADAVFFARLHYHSMIKVKYQRPRKQLWAWAEIEAPAQWHPSPLVNWTMTYHSNSDVVDHYGYFTEINATQLKLVANLMSSYPVTMQKYKDGLASGITRSDIIGPDWKKIMNKTQIVAWMSSNCKPPSKRTRYIRKLAKHMDVHMYGHCGNRNCFGRNPYGNDTCWNEIMAVYSFYMSMENQFCEEYITEKVYLPLTHNIVPVVWGGSDYSQFLPPGSYIDARQYHPKDLAKLLTDLHNDPEAYSKYHLWRGYFKAHLGGILCQFCYRLQMESEVRREHRSGSLGKCYNVPDNLFSKNTRPVEWQRFLEQLNSTMR